MSVASACVRTYKRTGVRSRADSIMVGLLGNECSLTMLAENELVHVHTQDVLTVSEWPGLA